VFPVDIEAPNGDYRTYTIIVNKAASTDSSLKDIIVSDGTLDPVFNPGILYYEVLVPEELEQITVTGITNDPLSKIEGNGTYQIEDLETEIKLVVTSEDGNKTTYVVKVIRDVESLSTLKELILKDGEIYPKFHKLITSYMILVPYETRSFKMDSEPFNMIYTPEDPEATVVVSGNTNFRIGSNKMTIEVTSKDGQSVTEYIVSVVRQSAASNYLKSLEVKNVDETVSYKMTPVFTKENLYYEVTVPMDVDTIKIKASLDDLTSTLSGTGTKYLNVGINRFYVTVESASGVIRSYQIVINRAESTENKLLTLTHDVGIISPSFDPETNDYVITVPEKTTEITLDGTASENSTIIGLGTFPVVAGEQTKIITVTSQSGENNVYTVKIVRPASSNTNLISLTPSAGTIEFDNDKNEYEIEVDDNVSVISFTAVPEDSDAIVTGLDLTTLTYGENEVTITVTAEDGITTRDILVKIKKSKRLNAIIASEEEILLSVDEYMDISYTLDPADTIETKVIWSSNDDSIATVDQNGRITGKKIGSTQVVVMSATNNSIHATIIVNVINKRIISDVYEINRFEDEEMDNNEESEEEQDEKIAHVIGLEPSTKLGDFIPNFENDPLTLHVYYIYG
ncbi:MAG: cadherin-like beta sandwich domain-containing protein, partial [Clostridia bacterium]|nr:cadherin-like beta sandwich domain-containing protein [Clostridia bacterium]